MSNSNQKITYTITPKKKKRKVASEKKHEETNGANHTAQKNNKKLTRISTDPDMKSTLVNLPSLMQTATHLTPIEHAKESPKYQQIVPYPPAQNIQNSKRKQTAPIMKRKPLPAMPHKPLPNKPLPSNNTYGSNGVTTTTRTSAKGTTTTTTTFITYEMPSNTQQAANKRGRGMTTGTVIPTFVPMGTKHNDIKQMQSATARNANQNTVHNMGTISFSSAPDKGASAIQYQYSVPNISYDNKIHSTNAVYHNGNNIHNIQQQTNKPLSTSNIFGGMTYVNDDYDLGDDTKQMDYSSAGPPQSRSAGDITSEAAPKYSRAKPKTRSRKKRTQTYGNVARHQPQLMPAKPIQYSNSNEQQKPKHRKLLSDTEVITPTANSPYHPNNYQGVTWYKPKSPHNTTYTQNTTMVVHTENPQLFQQQRTSRSHTTFTVKPRHRTRHSKSNAIPPPHIPQKGVSFSPHANRPHAIPPPFIPPLAMARDKRAPDFGLGMIMIPGQNKKERFDSDDDDDESEPSVTMPTLQKSPMSNKVLPNDKNTAALIKNNQIHIRRNSDTIVYTPCDSAAVSDSTFMDMMKHAPEKRKSMHVRTRINNAEALEHNLQHVTDVTPVSQISDAIPSPFVPSSGSMSVASHPRNLSLVEEVNSNAINTILPQFGGISTAAAGHTRNQSAPMTPSQTIDTPLAPVMDDGMFDEPLPNEMEAILPLQTNSFSPPKNVSMVHETNKKLIDKLLGFKGSIWNFDNEIVDIFHEQCRSVKYENIVPNLIDVLYPTMLSSLALPAKAKSAQYVATIKYNLASFVSVEERIAQQTPIVTNQAEHERLYALQITFSHKTSIKIAVEEIVFKIKQNHPKYADYLNKLHLNCFVLKVCGREEYLKPDGKNNKIMALSHIRDCIRKNEVNNLGLILLYDDSLNELIEVNIRRTLRASYDRYYYKPENSLNFNSANKLKYEKMGTNVITNTLVATIGANADKLTHNLEKLNEDIESEIIWLKQKVGTVFGGDQTSVNYTPSNAGFNYNTYNTVKSDLNEFEWNEVEREAVLLPEFEHPVIFEIEALSNIMLCERFRAKNKQHFTYILRIELMFGVHVFEDASWDIIIPKEQLSNNICMPREFCTFSTAEAALHYASLPRESVWCFTLYGVSRNKEIAKELKEKRKKQDKKQKKNEPKILRAFIDQQRAGGHSVRPSVGDHLHGGGTANFIHSKTIAEDFEGMIGTESINDFYNGSNNTMRSNTMRSTTSYDLDDEAKNAEAAASQYSSEPLAWCRLPLIDHNHCLRKGVIELKLWTVPVFEKIKGGPKIDPYTTGNWKKFGTMRDANLARKTGTNSVVLRVNFVIDYKFDVVAPIVNQRRPHYIRTKIKMHNNKQKQKKEFSRAQVLNAIIQKDGIYPLDERDKLLVYSNKDKLMRDPATIPTFLRSVSWLDQESRMEAYDYLDKWSPPKNPEDMIELLRYEFADNRIRLYAINCLNQLDDYTLNRCLLQLVQALKNEAQHSSFLARFLMVRALHNPFQIGHYLFWHLKSEYHDNNLQFMERYGLLLREYLLHLPYYPLYSNINLAQELVDENELIKRLKFISMSIKNLKASKKKSSNKNLQNLLHHQLTKLNNDLFADANKSKSLPLNPAYKVGELIFDECRFMSSAKAPLWLVFSNADRYETGTISVMFKCGDDLRQDILTLQLISIMDAFWLSSSIDLNMMTYQVIGTGYQVGMLELLLNSKTTNDIGSAFNNKTHLKYIMNTTKVNQHLTAQQRKNNYARSVAGCSVATWTLGIGDRHPDNIMIHENGTLFHIDFGHFLGNFKEKDMGAFGKWKRERTPFVFTNAMKYCIEGSGSQKKKKSKQRASYAVFVKWLFDAYCEIRIRYKFFLNLLLLMVPSQMPELITESDVAFFKDVLRFDLIDDVDSIASHVEATLNLCLSDKNKKFDDMFHKINHL